jgi:hypothetical protein
MKASHGGLVLRPLARPSDRAQEGQWLPLSREPFLFRVSSLRRLAHREFVWLLVLKQGSYLASGSRPQSS